MTTTPQTTDAEPTIESLTGGSTERRRAPADAITHFKTSEVVDLLALSRRQLQYWAKTGLVEPSARTRGGHHRYDFNDLVALKATKRLIDGALALASILEKLGLAVAKIPELPLDILDWVKENLGLVITVGIGALVAAAVLPSAIAAAAGSPGRLSGAERSMAA